MLKKLKSRKVTIALATVLVVSLLAGCGGTKPAAKTDDKPAEVKFTKPISIVLPSAAGAPIDVMARLMAKLAEKQFGQSLVALNKTGGSGNVALAYTQAQPADGYHIHAEATGITSVLQLPGAQYSYKDFEYVIRLVNDPFVLYVGKDSKYKTIEEFIAAAKAKPGEITVGGYGTGSPHHIFAENLAKMAGVKIKWVAFNSGNDALVATMGGHIDATLSNASLLPQSKGQVIALGQSSENKLADFPDVPMFKEKGFPELVKYHWRGILVKKGTPPEVVKALHDGLKKMMDDPEWKKYVKDSAMLDGYMNTEDFTKMVYGQADNDLKVLKELGLVK